jgi:LmbE family N-acetylglucosaminyl deacetylase
VLSLFPKKLKNVLCLGAHCDDIEIGCGGTMLRLVRERPEVSVHWVVFGSDTVRAREARDSASKFLGGVRHKTVTVKDFKNSFFPYCGEQIKEIFEQLKGEVAPDIIFTHSREDLHQDHRIVSELTWNTFRDHLILEYEIPKYDGDLGRPNLFVPLTDEEWKGKIDLILASFESQKNKRWFTRDTFQSIMRLRGVESNSPSGYAEGFSCRKVTFDCVAGP